MRLADDPGVPGTLDEQRVRAAADGDQAAWQQLVASYEREVWELASACTARADEAAAVCELVWRRLAQDLGQLGDEPVGLWLQRTTRLESERAQLRSGRRPAAADPTERRHGPRARKG